ncbi:MAG TPA: acyl-CoA thioesterase [Solirubrobacteraceae bacterium]|jgi:acyl-CoA hydrolase|nr:acyl-CoA thioesterase [Solirubrobacteraceae bacterium]
MEPRTVNESRSVLVQWMGPTDANPSGFVHGGTVMKLCDEAAATAAIRHSSMRVVTAAVDRMTFLAPVHVGELLTLRSSVNAAWRTSMEVGVRVEAENPISGEIRHTNSAYITMVAVDEDGHPVAAVPNLRCESPDELRRERDAQVRRANRLAEREQLLEHEVEGKGAQPA